MKEKHPPIKIVALVTNARTEAPRLALLKKVDTFLAKQNITRLYNSHAAKALGFRGATHETLMTRSDLVITLGGDGTLLRLARHASHKTVPVLAFNMGRLGFLTEVQNLREVIPTLTKVLKGNFQLDIRTLLRVTLYRNKKKLESFVALNEAVINQGNFARLIELSATINQRRMVRFKADGVIVSTPTGSTGHALSAGGPIVHPKLEALVFAPICASSLGMRPIVLPGDREITLNIETERRFEDNHIALTLDGQIVRPLHYGDQIKLRRSTRHFALVRMTNTRYYTMLRDKLNWGE